MLNGDLHRLLALLRPKRPLFWLAVIGLYGVTWVGGWTTHARDLDASAWRKYRKVEEMNAAYVKAGEEVPTFALVRPGGPATGVRWCVPICPGILLADSYEVIGPLSANSSVKILFYYGPHCAVLAEPYAKVT
jgi:hypothetical protein